VIRTDLEEFEKAVKAGDFVVGDSFWLDDIEFEVVSKRKLGEAVQE